MSLHYSSLVGFFALYYSATGWLTFAPRFYAALGCTDSQIGLLTSIPALIGMLAQPLWGLLSDRMNTKRTVLNIVMACLTVASFWVGQAATMVMLMCSLTVFLTFQLPVMSLSSAIAIEYAQSQGKRYGIIRVMGTFGYQAGALLAGYALKNDITKLYPYTGIVLAMAFVCSLLLPPIKGHQHGRQRISVFALLKNKKVVLLYAMILIGSITAKYYFSFFTKYLGDLGIDSTMTGIITLISVTLEIPFLLWGDKLYRKAPVWNWLLLAFVLNGIRWIGISVSKSVLAMIIFQIPTVTVVACFEFLPSLWLNDNVPLELTGSAQAVLGFISLGLARVIGSLLGGVISDAVGIPTVFAFNGIFLFVAAAVFFFPTRKLAREEAAAKV